MTIVVTGVAGFIGFHTAQRLLARGERVVGIDNLNDYYSVDLKKARLGELEGQANFTFKKGPLPASRSGRWCTWAPRPACAIR
jgi:UDP-glucuronate 4-epimerase